MRFLAVGDTHALLSADLTTSVVESVCCEIALYMLMLMHITVALVVLDGKLHKVMQWLEVLQEGPQRKYLTVIASKL